jgi:holo-[acyl-carrier protein] synthase
MKIESGIDLIEVERIKKAIKRWPNKFIDRIFTQGEIEYAKNKKMKYEHLAARFATKEAVLKAFGQGTRRYIRWKEIEVSKLISGKPSVKIHGFIKELKEKDNIKDISISMSHTKHYAVASCVLIK